MLYLYTTLSLYHDKTYPIIIRKYFTVNFVHVRFSLMSEMTLQINHFDPTDIHLHRAEGNLDIARLTLPGRHF